MTTLITPWTGGSMPVAYGTIVEVQHRDGEVHICRAGDEESPDYLFARDWSIDPDAPEDGDIMAYRVVGAVGTVARRGSTMNPDTLRARLRARQAQAAQQHAKQRTLHRVLVIALIGIGTTLIYLAAGPLAAVGAVALLTAGAI